MHVEDKIKELLSPVSDRKGTYIVDLEYGSISVMEVDSDDLVVTLGPSDFEKLKKHVPYGAHVKYKVNGGEK